METKTPSKKLYDIAQLIRHTLSGDKLPVIDLIDDLAKYPNFLSQDKLVALHQRHKVIMETKNILVSVYTNASGFLWTMMKVDSGTGLGYSDHTGDCEQSGTFTSYEKALENALNLIDKCDLKTFQKECPNNKFHWGNYAQWLIDKK